MMRFGTILLITCALAATVHIDASAEGLDLHDDAFPSPDNAQEAFSADHSATGPKVSESDEDGSKPAFTGCGVHTVGEKYHHRYLFDMDFSHQDFMDSDEDDDVNDTENKKGSDSILSFDVMMKIEPLSIKAGEQSELFRLDVTDVILVNNTPEHAAAKAKLLGLLDSSETSDDDILDDDEIDQYALSRKFMGSFYYRQSCDGEILEVKHSRDESGHMVLAKRMMAVSFFEASQNVAPGTAERGNVPVFSRPSREEEEDEEEHETTVEEDSDEDEDEDEEYVDQDVDDFEGDHDSVIEEAEATFDSFETMAKTMSSESKKQVIAQEPTTKEAINQDAEVPSTADKQGAEENVELEIAEAKQPVEPASSHCLKGSDAMDVEGQKQGTPSSKGFEKCAATKPKLSSKVNQTCTTRPVRPRS